MEERNYEYFTGKWSYYIPSVADTFAYSLLDNHFHALVKIKEGALSFRNIAGLEYTPIPERQYSHMLNGYAQGFNATYHRTGSLFEHPFKRTIINNKKQLINTLAYILFNPQKHEFAVNFRHYPYSSYQLLINDNPSFIDKETVLEWFGGKEKFVDYMNRFEEKCKARQRIRK